MNEYEDDDRGGRDDAPPADIAAAKAKVAMPGLLLQISAVIGFLLTAAFAYPVFVAPTWGLDVTEKFIVDNQPPGPEKDKAIQDLADQRAEILKNPTPNLILGVLQMGVVFIASLALLIAATKMKSLGGTGWGIAAGVLGVIGTGCCCIGLPAGIWAIVAASNPNYKAACLAVRRGARRD